MAYFGGFPGVGTLYWENLDGLRAATAIYAASTPEALRGLLEQRGVTHLVLFPWDRGLELLRLSSEASGAPVGPEPFLAAVVRGLRAPGVVTLPAWLTPLPYPAPPTEALGHPAAVMLEIVPDQPRELALVRLAQYYQAVGAPAETEAALRASLDVRPSAPAWALLAQLEAARGVGAEFWRALGGLRSALAAGEPVAAGDRFNAAVALALGRDGTGRGRRGSSISRCGTPTRPLYALSPRTRSRFWCGSPASWGSIGPTPTRSPPQSPCFHPAEAGGAALASRRAGKAGPARGRACAARPAWRRRS
ncbi:MAG: hypothetical protein EXR95_01725 [Gemmatimonadetes bacterium]|nr:hypothetical protein [Gemmatimonadota bacterium]